METVMEAEVQIVMETEVQRQEDWDCVFQDLIVHPGGFHELPSAEGDTMHELSLSLCKRTCEHKEEQGRHRLPSHVRRRWQ